MNRNALEAGVGGRFAEGPHEPGASASDLIDGVLRCRTAPFRRCSHPSNPRQPIVPERRPLLRQGEVGPSPTHRPPPQGAGAPWLYIPACPRRSPWMRRVAADARPAWKRNAV